MVDGLSPGARPAVPRTHVTAGTAGGTVTTGTILTTGTNGTTRKEP